METYSAGTLPTLLTVTVYSSVAPGMAGAPSTTATFFVIDSCCTSPTMTTVGSGPVEGSPSPSVKRFGSSAL